MQGDQVVSGALAEVHLTTGMLYPDTPPTPPGVIGSILERVDGTKYFAVGRTFMPVPLATGLELLY